jgi:O-antigen/teichoic acid export membrane protein
MIKEIIKSSAIYGLAPYVPRIISFLLLPLLTEHLTDVDYGISGTIAAYTGALQALTTLGLSAYLQVNFFKAPCQYKILWRQLYGFLLLWMLVFAVIQSTLLYFVIPEEAAENKWLIILLTNFNGVIFGPAGFIGPMYYQLSKQPMPVAIRTIISGLASVLINYLTIVIFEWGYMGWYVSSFMGVFITNAIYWYDLNYKLKLKPILRPKKRTVAHALKVSLPMVPHYYSGYLISTSNKVVMDLSNTSIKSIGEFNFAQTFSSMAESAVFAIETAIKPINYESIKLNKEEESKRAIYTYALLTYSMTFLFALWCKELFGLMVHNDVLVGTYPLAAFLVLAYNYRPMYIAATNVMFYYERTLQVLKITMVAGIIALIANIIFIPKYGLPAAAIITYLSFLYQGYAGFVTKIFKEKSTVRYPVVGILIFQLLITIISMAILDVYWPYKVIITIIWCICSFFFAKRYILVSSKWFMFS